MAYEYCEGLDHIARERYNAKLAAAGLKSCPYKLEAGRWQNDPSKWPDVQYPDIYSYLIDTPGVYTKDSMKNYRSLEAHNYFISGWVKTVYYCVTDSDLYLMKADVKPSQRINNEPHHPWVVIKKDGVVTAAHCNCMAGLGESCSHVAALLFKIEAAVRMGYTTTACTDELCAWNQCFSDTVQPAPIYDINFYKDESKGKLGEKGPRGRPPFKANEQQQQSFLMKLAASSPKSVCLSTFDQFASHFKPVTTIPEPTGKLPMNLRDLYDVDNSKNLNSAIQDAKERVSQTSKAERDYIRKASSEQSESTTWHEMRLGRVTASRMHSVLHTNAAKPAPSIVKNICSPAKSISHIAAITWGRDHESDAIDAYLNKHRESHEGIEASVSVERTGLWLHEEHAFIGASPDALVHCSICGFGVLEVKCPHKYRDYQNQELVLLDNNCYMNEQFHLNSNHSYYAQVQTQIMVCKADYADFVLWTPYFTILDRILPDTIFFKTVLNVVPQFWAAHCLPELLTRKLENGEVVRDDGDKENEGGYPHCYCKTETGGLMMGCDNPGCKLKWFHLTCLRRKRAPKGEWYYKDCKKLMQ